MWQWWLQRSCRQVRSPQACWALAVHATRMLVRLYKAAWQVYLGRHHWQAHVLALCSPPALRLPDACFSAVRKVLQRAALQLRVELPRVLQTSAQSYEPSVGAGWGQEALAPHVLHEAASSGEACDVSCKTASSSSDALPFTLYTVAAQHAAAVQLTQLEIQGQAGMTAG